MLLHKRDASVLAATLVSIAVGGLVLRLIGSTPPAAGAFSLSDYYQLQSPEDAILSRAPQHVGRWNHIDIFYTYCPSPKANDIAYLNITDDPRDNNCHFLIFSQADVADGQITPTENWQRQFSIAPDLAPGPIERTIRVCVAIDTAIGRPTNSQIKRAEAVAEALARKFNIQTSDIAYPKNWWIADSG